VAEGNDVSVHYDPLIAKVIATGETRAAAIARLTQALRTYPILGIRTNIPFLLRVVGHPRFTEGTVDTSFLEGDGATLAAAPDAEVPVFVRAALEQWQVENRRSKVESSSLRDASAVSRQPSAIPAWDPWTRVREWRP
jgi:acetyl/propionyl-CoA carboxylase alpha subunit